MGVEQTSLIFLPTRHYSPPTDSKKGKLLNIVFYGYGNTFPDTTFRESKL